MGRDNTGKLLDVHHQEDSQLILNQAYFERVQEVMLQILDLSCAPDDPLLLIYQEYYPYRFRFRKSDPVLVQLRRSQIPVQFRRYRVKYLGEDSRLLRALALTTCANIDLAPIFRAKAHQDFPSLGEKVRHDFYVVNLARRLVLHMHDDRWADLIAKAPETLDGIRSALGPVLMKYDWQTGKTEYP